MILSGWLQKVKGKLMPRGGHGRRRVPAPRAATIRPRLEYLEDRVVPAAIDTTTNVAINITPNIVARTATETITATVTQADSNTPVTAGNVFFNVNNNPLLATINGPQPGTVALNSNGQATLTTTLPLYAVAVPQTLEASYEGVMGTANPSTFLSPVYLNVLDALLPSNITFAGPPLSQPTLPIHRFGSYNGESDNLNFFGKSIDFHYVDPGTIQDFTIGGFTFSGSLANKLLGQVESAWIDAGLQPL